MDINSKINNASKWSLITEIVSKLMAPITNMVLARELAPEAFGMVATITMVTSFADIFTDAGFQKYLVQKEFYSDEKLNQNTNVAFWTNFSLSLIIWALIVAFRHPLAQAVGNAGLGNAIAIASLSIPMTSFSSIQMARYRRDFDFKTIFYAKFVGILVPLFVTIPLAFVMKSFWALIIGTLAVQLSNTVLLTIRSKWKPKLYYSFAQFKEMISFSLWTLMEQLLGWANLNIGIFIVGRFLSDYYLGLYKTSMASANQVMSIIVNAFSPVILATLSRLKDEDKVYKSMFYKFESHIGLIIIPLGVGIFVYREFFTRILLGSQWGEAINFIGLWGFMRAMHIVFGMFSMEVFISMGKPKYSVVSQVAELFILLPTLLIAAPKGYNILYIARSGVALWCILVEMTLLKIVADISPVKIFKVNLPYIIASVFMGAVGAFLLKVNSSIIWQILSVVICVVFYGGVICINSSTRSSLFDLFSMFVKKK